MSQSNPTVVIVPGAWHSPWHYDKIIALFVEADYPVISSRLPSVDSPNPKDVLVATDAAFIRETLLGPLIEEGKEIVLIMHSYGGSPGAAAAKGLSKTELSAESKKGGIIGLIFICALLAIEGDSLLSKIGGKFDPWVIINNETGNLNVSDPKEVFYADVPDPLASEAIAHLRPESMSALTSPSPPPAWPDSVHNGRRAYIRTLEDKTIPSIAQEMMIKYSGVEWVVKVLNTSHSPFLSQPKQLFNDLVGLAKDFATSSS